MGISITNDKEFNFDYFGSTRNTHINRCNNMTFHFYTSRANYYLYGLEKRSGIWKGNERLNE